MPTGIDLIGDAAFQEHWIKRLIALIVDAVILSVVTIVLNALFQNALFGLGVWWPFIFGVLWVLYATLLEASSGRATLGKKIVSLRVVAIDGPMTAEKALVRNISKVHPLLVLLDWILGIATQGDPRQRYLDRIARTTVTRVDANAYIEERFRQMQHVPPHPTPPPAAAWGQPAPAQPGPTTQATMTPPAAQAPPSGGWPGQAPTPPGGGWPQHKWDEEGRLVPQMRYCTACGGQLVQRGDGKLTCVRCGAVY